MTGKATQTKSPAGARAANRAAPPAATACPVFALAAGLFFFLTIIKLGDPFILDAYIEKGRPTDLASAFAYAWPPLWGAWMFLPLALVALFAVEWRRAKVQPIIFLPLIWLLWELAAATHTISPPLTKLTITHFTVCVGLFYAGYFATKGMSNPWPVWAGMGLALCWAMRGGMEQHFGGLEATRKWMLSTLAHAGVDPKVVASGTPLSQHQIELLRQADLDPATVTDPDFWKRLDGNRIFSVFGNANTLAGALILLLPLTLVFVWRLTPKVRTSVRVLFMALLGGCGLACLYWSGSKAGWLVALTIGLVALGHSALPLKWRKGLIYGVLILGLAGFAVKYAPYFKKERNSIGARFAYWKAALTVIDHHPLLGTGPGTFQIPYAQIKRPGDEMAKLCHNDYLEQASDSGVLGLVSYTGMILAFLFYIYRYSIQKSPLNWLNFAVWIGILGVCLHSLVDFHLYVASVAWPMFFLCGWMMSRNN